MAMKNTLKFTTFNYRTNSDDNGMAINPDIKILIQQSTTLSQNIDSISSRQSMGSKRPTTILVESDKKGSRNNQSKVKPFSVSNSVSKLRYPKLSANHSPKSGFKASGMNQAIDPN